MADRSAFPVVLVTAGSRGLGAAICRRAAADGWTVAVNYNASAGAAEAVAADIRNAGGRAQAFRADVTDEAAVEAMFRSIDRELGPVSGLVNNAGGGRIVLGPQGATVGEATGAAMRDLLALNVVSAMLCAREAVRRMARSRGGTGGAIVNVSSDCARRGGPTSRLGAAEGLVHYAAAKAAVDGFTISAATELGPEGIRVNAVRPATILTDAPKTPEQLAGMARIIPLGRPARAEEVAENVAYLLSEHASFVTGALLDVTGGR